MPIGDLIKKAGSYFLGYDETIGENCNGDKEQMEHLENEILFCKNNVCVHPPPTTRSNFDVVHNPGYLTITRKTFIDQYNDVKRPTLYLNWIPNQTLSKCSTELQNDRLYLKQNAFNLNNKFFTFANNGTNPFLNDMRPLVDLSTPDVENDHLRININVEIANPNIEICSTPDSIKDIVSALQTPKIMDFDNSETNSVFEFSRSNSLSYYEDTPMWMTTPEALAHRHNLNFPESASSSPIVRKKSNQAQCRRFSVDLSQMRSLRLFFSDNSCTCGQLVVASRESQYKILHFHHGGLDHLAQVLHQWHSLLHNIKLTKGGDENLPYRHFMVCRPEVSMEELHPDEGQVLKLSSEMLSAMMNNDGQIEDDLALRRAVFFGGIERCLKSTVWPFLLHVYPFHSTYDDRITINNLRRQEYDEITRRRLADETEKFQRGVKYIVEKDVIRTDRANPFFAGDNNPNIETMKNILLNYAYYNPSIGYTQGMSDLLAPVLCEIGEEALSFWCFVGLMQRCAFIATPTDSDMEKYLKYLRELIRIMVPKFYKHLEKHQDSMELLFCHRWILLCFKREFSEGVALQMWEACWSNYLTDYFHLFLCLAIICVYADDVIAQDLRADEMLLHFSSLAMYMEGHVILRKARGLLYQYRQLTRIPCTLKELCKKCGPGQWDSMHSPIIECVATPDCPCAQQQT